MSLAARQVDTNTEMIQGRLPGDGGGAGEGVGPGGGGVVDMTEKHVKAALISRPVIKLQEGSRDEELLLCVCVHVCVWWIRDCAAVAEEGLKGSRAHGTRHCSHMCDAAASLSFSCLQIPNPRAQMWVCRILQHIITG